MRGRSLLAFLAVTAAAVIALLGSAVAASSYNLNGTWRSDDGVGTTLTLTQTATGFSWVGGPNDDAWIQNYTATLAGAHFTGTFWQDAPGVQPQRYHGTINGTVVDDCHIRLDDVIQAGQATLHGVAFARTGCVQAPKPVAWSVRAKELVQGTTVTIIGGGSFTADDGGQIGSEAAARGNLVVTFHSKRVSSRNDVWHLRVTGPGNYVPRGYVRLVAEVMNTANHARRLPCLRDPFGVITVSKVGPHRDAVAIQSICGMALLLKRAGSAHVTLP